jgi:glucose/arabinose dehydrogenase
LAGGSPAPQPAFGDDALRTHERSRGIVVAVAVLFAAAVVPVFLSAKGETALPLEKIRLPAGFEIRVFARVPNARSLARSPNGTLFVGTREDGGVYAVRDGSGRPDSVVRIARGLNMPNGVAIRDGALYVAEVHRLLRYDGIEARLENPPPPVVVREFPPDRHHGWKFIAFGPDGLLYVPVGAPCNICQPEPMYAAIHRMRPDGSGFETFARGVRNTVGFDWHPETHELWFTDNGRDMLGDDIPPDELNNAPRAGMDFGFPTCHGRNIPDPDFGRRRPCSATTPPALELGPHVASLGMRFYTGRMFPEKYRKGIFIAEHGSWNRTHKIGYRVMFVPLENGRPAGYEVFAQGWLQGESAWGRPVDVLVTPDGALLVSDDESGTVYRISYRR